MFKAVSLFFSEFWIITIYKTQDLAEENHGYKWLIATAHARTEISAVLVYDQPN